MFIHTVKCSTIARQQENKNSFFTKHLQIQMINTERLGRARCNQFDD